MMEEEEDTLFDQEGLLGDRSAERAKHSEWKKKLLKTIALTLAFFSLGCCVAIPGATLLDLGQRVGKDTEHMTLIATSRSAGYLIGAVFGGILSDLLDHQLLLFCTLTFTSIATIVIPWCTVFYTLTGMIGVQGIALGVLDTGGNVFCIRIWGKKSPPYLQFLHFGFAIGAFIAPLIAHPFLLNSFEKFSSNRSLDNNVSTKAILPYATSEHFIEGRHKRDLFFHNPFLHFEKVENLDPLSYSIKHRREAIDPVDDVDPVNRTIPVNSSSLMNETHVRSTTSLSDLEPTTTTIRPKKPEVVKPLSKEHADSQLIVDKLKDLKKNPITGNEDKEEEKSNEGEDTSTPVTVGDLGLGKSGNNTNSNSSVTNSSSPGDEAIEKQKPATLPTALQTSANNVNTSLSPAPSTTLTMPSTTSSTTTQSTTSTTSKPTPKSNAPDAATDTTTTNVSIANSSMPHNNTALDEPETWRDLVYDMLDTMRHMSNIQFAYLIIGLILIANAGFFVVLFCKDKLSGFRLSAISHEDLTRPPDTPCFVGTLLLLLFVFFLLYVGMEQTYGLLLTTFAVEFPSTVWTPAQGDMLTAVFWGCVAFGRGISICVSRFFKAPCMLVSNLALCLLGATILSFALRTSWIFLWVGTVLLGLGMSSLFPTTITWTDSYYPLTGKAASVFVAGSGVGQMIIPVATGFLYQNVDRMCLMYMVFSLSILLCIIYTFLQIVASRRANVNGTTRSHSGFMRLQTSEDIADSLDMDLIQAGNMDRPLARREEETQLKHNGVSGEYEVTEFSKLVELSD